MLTSKEFESLFAHEEGLLGVQILVRNELSDLSEFLVLRGGLHLFKLSHLLLLSIQLLLGWASSTITVAAGIVITTHICLFIFCLSLKILTIN
jgi:hypothetical protein